MTLTTMPYKRAQVVGCALLCVSTSAQAQDEWWGRDKALHFGVSGVLAGGGYALSSLLFESRVQRAALGGGVALGAGVAKEVYDELDYGGASYKDLTFDLAGVAVGVAAAILIDLALRDDERKPIASNYRGFAIHF